MVICIVHCIRRVWLDRSSVTVETYASGLISDSSAAVKAFDPWLLSQRSTFLSRCMTCIYNHGSPVTAECWRCAFRNRLMKQYYSMQYYSMLYSVMRACKLLLSGLRSAELIIVLSSTGKSTSNITMSTESYYVFKWVSVSTSRCVAWGGHGRISPRQRWTRFFDSLIRCSTFGQFTRCIYCFMNFIDALFLHCPCQHAHLLWGIMLSTVRSILCLNGVWGT